MTAVNPMTNAAAVTVVLMRLLVNIALRSAAAADTPITLLLLYWRLLQAVIVDAAARRCDGVGNWRFRRLARGLLWGSYQLAARV